MERVKADTGATCTMCRKSIRKGSWVTVHGGFWRHPKCAVPTADCEACGQRVPLREDGNLTEHFRYGDEQKGICDASPVPEEPKACGGCGEPAPSHDKWCQLDQRPVSVAPATVESMDENKPGPLFEARYDGECNTCDCAFYEGELIRADGEGGWQCERCADKSPDQPTTSPPPVTPKPDPFESPSTVEREMPVPETNVSGQREPLRDQWGRYLLPNPATGLYSDGKDKATRRNGWTRATTFAKAAADTFALTRYDERLTLVGATLRPDVVALAHGKQVREDAKELNQLVLQIKDAAGAKVAANHGTAVHSFTERIDAGLMKAPEVPEAYRPMVVAYREKLKEAGLEVVPGLIERTTFVNRWNGLCGTLDRVLYHRPSGTYLIGDVKTGRDLSYGRMEIAVQLALYAHGVNRHGVFNWNWNYGLDDPNPGEWLPPGTYGDSVETGPWQVPKVRMDYGVVMHLPIQGDDAGKCFLKRVNLASGWEVAQVCGDVLASRKRGDYMEDGLELPGVPYVPETPDHRLLPTPAETDWESMFLAVPTKEAASHLWREAKADGVAGLELQRLVGLAQQRLRELGVSG